MMVAKIVLCSDLAELIEKMKRLLCRCWGVTLSELDAMLPLPKLSEKPQTVDVDVRCWDTSSLGLVCPVWREGRRCCVCAGTLSRGEWTRAGRSVWWLRHSVFDYLRAHPIHSDCAPVVKLAMSKVTPGLPGQKKVGPRASY